MALLDKITALFNSRKETADEAQPKFLKAAETGDTTEITRIVKIFPDAVKWSNGYGTGLIIAARHGHKPAAEVLLDKGTDIEAKGLNSRTALFIAAQEGQEGMAKLLIERGAFTGGPPPAPYHNTPFFAAEERGKSKIMTMIKDAEGLRNDYAAKKQSELVAPIVAGTTERVGLLKRIKLKR